MQDDFTFPRSEAEPSGEPERIGVIVQRIVARVAARREADHSRTKDQDDALRQGQAGGSGPPGG